MEEKPRPLTIRERRALKAYLEGAKMADVARAYGSKAKDEINLAISASQMLRRIRPSIKEEMEHIGLTNAVIFNGVLQGFSSQKVVTATHEGRITDERFYPDPSTRKAYYELAARMGGLLVDKHEITGENGLPIEINIRPAPETKDED